VGARAAASAFSFAERHAHFYGATAGVSVVSSNAGAFFPGIMLAGLYMLYVIIMRCSIRSWRPAAGRRANVPTMTVIWGAGDVICAARRLIGAALGLDLFGLPAV